MNHDLSLSVVDMGINTHQELVVYMRKDCPVCHAEGFNASSRVVIEFAGYQVIATLNVVETKASSCQLLQPAQIGLSDPVMKRLKVSAGDKVAIHHAPLTSSFSSVRKKTFGHSLSKTEIEAIIKDISLNSYSDIEIASFLSVCAGGRLSLDEVISLTQAMVHCGKQLDWSESLQKDKTTAIYDKHCIGGIPGNRTTPLVVSIVSAAGLVIPKTSSRAITSPAGTADTMEALTSVELQLDDIKRVVKQTGACLAWGGAVNLSPADDLLIRIERALDLDGEGQLIASVISKKIAAGSTHAVIDIPVGDTAKVRTQADAQRLSGLFTQVGDACGIKLRCVITDGSCPIGAGLGPVEEARDLLKILQCESDAPIDLRDRAILLAGHLLDMAQGCGLELGLLQAKEILQSGTAWSQFQKIVKAQGGFKSLASAPYQYCIKSLKDGVITAIDNRKLARLAKLAGAPFDAIAGIRLLVNVGSVIEINQPLFNLLCDSQGELDYALEFYQNNLDIFTIEAS